MSVGTYSGTMINLVGVIGIVVDKKNCKDEVILRFVGPNECKLFLLHLVLTSCLLQETKPQFLDRCVKGAGERKHA